MTDVKRIDPGRFGHAAALAAELHAGQMRKGTEIPYLSHLLAVAALVAEDGGDEDTVLAALLHDSAEDQGGERTLERIADELGTRVSKLVRECSDAVPEPGAEKPPWRERKQQMVDSLPSLSHGARLVIAADKLHNTRSTILDVRIVGPDVWNRFRTGREGFLWYHQQMLAALHQLIPKPP